MHDQNPNQTKLDLNIDCGRDDDLADRINNLAYDMYNYGDPVKRGALLTQDYLEGVGHGAIFGVCDMLNALATWYEGNPDLTSRTHYERLNQFSRLMGEAAEYAEGTAAAGAYYGAHVKTRNLSQGFLSNTQTSDTAAAVLRNYAENLQEAHNHRYPN